MSDPEARVVRSTALALVVAGVSLGFAIATASVYASRTSAQRGGEKKKLSHETWYEASDKDGRISSLDSVRRGALEGGIPQSLRQDVWPVLLGVRSCSSTSVEYEQGKRARRGRYREFHRRCAELEDLLSKPAKGPVNLPTDLASFTEASRVIANDVPRTTLTYGPFARDWESGILSSAENEPMDWQSAQRQRLIRVLEAYVILDPVIGYTQGMNDLAAVFLRDISNESEAFWCFAKFMGGSYRCHFLINPHESVRSRHGESQEGVSDRLRVVGEIIRLVDAPMHKHLKFLNAQDCMFALRPLLVLMSRELADAEIGFLWDALIAAGDNEPTIKDGVPLAGGGARLFLHTVAAALIEMRSKIMACRKNDELMQLVARKLPVRGFKAADLVHKARDLMKITHGVGEAMTVVSRATVMLKEL